MWLEGRKQRVVLNGSVLLKFADDTKVARVVESGEQKEEMHFKWDLAKVRVFRFLTRNVCKNLITVQNTPLL